MTGARTDPVELLTDSLKIYSPTGGESELAGHLSDVLGALGFSQVRNDAAGNIIGEVGHGDRSLLLCGHMDTVPGELPVRREADSIFGRGASDAKSSLCALLIAGSRAADSGIRITFAGVTEEEGDGKGIDELIRGQTRYDYAVFGEPGSSRKLTIGYRGRVSLYVTVSTAGGHASSPWAHRSAFDEFSAVLSRLRDFEQSKTVKGDHYRSVSITPTIVRSGKSHNVVPDTCEATLDLRLPLHSKAGDTIQEIKRIAEASSDGTKVIVTAGHPTDAYEASSGSTIVRALQRAILVTLKARPILVRKTGTGDMNTFAEATKSQCVTYGPGDPQVSHTDHESVLASDYLASIEVLTEAIRQLSTLDAGSGS